MHHSFEPVIDHNSKILILGTLPGPMSLAKNEYYGYPRNAFWDIIGTLCEIPADADYAQKCKALLSHQLALWDVAHSAEREGALDSNLKNIVPNDFDELFARYKNLSSIVFNGGEAERLFKKHCRIQYETHPHARAPSTSPTNTRKKEEKQMAWDKIIIDMLREL